MKLKFKSKILIILGVIICVAYLNGFFVHPKLMNTQNYEPNTGNIKGSVNVSALLKENDAFEVGANQYGYAVYKNPAKAFYFLRKEYKEGINCIQKEFHLLPLTQLNYKQYMTYGWQVTTGTKEARNQAAFVTRFFDIYENSYEYVK